MPRLPKPAPFPDIVGRVRNLLPHSPASSWPPFSGRAVACRKRLCGAGKNTDLTVGFAIAKIGLFGMHAC